MTDSSIIKTERGIAPSYYFDSVQSEYDQVSRTMNMIVSTDTESIELTLARNERFIGFFPNAEDVKEAMMEPSAEAYLLVGTIVDSSNLEICPIGDVLYGNIRLGRLRINVETD